MKKLILLIQVTLLFLALTDVYSQWYLQTSGTTRGLYGVSFGDAYTGTIVGRLGTIVRTTNGGLSWSLQSSYTTSWLSGVSFTNANT